MKVIEKGTYFNIWLRLVITIFHVKFCTTESLLTLFNKKKSLKTQLLWSIDKYLSNVRKT